MATAAKSLQLCPTLCDPIDGSPPGPAVPGILQARTLEWVAISFSIQSSLWQFKANHWAPCYLSLSWIYSLVAQYCLLVLSIKCFLSHYHLLFLFSLYLEYFLLFPALKLFKIHLRCRIPKEALHNLPAFISVPYPHSPLSIAPLCLKIISGTVCTRLSYFSL